MKTCPKGAIVNFRELTRIQAAIEDAIALTEMELKSEMVPNPRWRTPDDRQKMRAGQTKLRAYRILLGKTRRARIAEAR